jgi:protein-tyrosine phosphatase
VSLTQVDDSGLLFISPVITDWTTVSSHGIDVVIDLEGGLDECIPTIPNTCLYVYLPIYDEELPNLARLEAVAMLGASLVRNSQRVLAHCGMGFNRSALVAGLILHKLGMDGPAIVERLRARRPGALFNEVFARHIGGLKMNARSENENEEE